MTNVKDLLKMWQKAKFSKIEQIKQNMNNCKKCDGKGNIDQDVKSYFGFSFPELCKCTEIDEKPISYYREDLNKIKKGFDFIDFEIPKEFHENLVVSKDEIDFLKSDKKILWLYNREKGAGKTTRAYSIASISRVLTSFNFKFVNESRLTFNTFSQEYQLDFQHQEIIIIDDVGVEPDKKGLLTDFYYRFFNDIRNTNCKVIFTSQFSISEWIEKLKLKNIEQGERIEDRFKGITLEKMIGIRE